MKNLTITNSRFLTYKDELFTIDVLGGVDMSQVERLVCTLRISFNDYPPYRTTLDLYNDSQVDKLMRTLCDKWELKLIEVSRTLHDLTMQLETYRLQELRYTSKISNQQPELSEVDKTKALELLKSKNLANQVISKLNTTGIIGEDENALILFLALSSYKFSNPFSVLCQAKSGIGKSYILQKLSECMPNGSYSFHTQLSVNALYYFDSNDIQGKALLIEDIEWTNQMLSPLSTLQSQGRLVKTRATKNKDGLIHSTSFEVTGKLCMVACAYPDKNLETIGLPFLCVNLNHSEDQDNLIMEYQKRSREGLVKADDVRTTQHLLRCMIATLENISIINPYATFIQLPKETPYPRKSLLLLLNFIDVITYFFQYQREQYIDKDTGEVFIKTHPDDIELAFMLLKTNLFKTNDELSMNTRRFYEWLCVFIKKANTNQFTALDVKKTSAIHSRTLNRYLYELKSCNYIQVIGGNKHREGFIYKLVHFDNENSTKNNVDTELESMMRSIRNMFNNGAKEELDS